MELEAKFECENLEKVRRRLEELGFKFTGKKHQVDYYFLVNKKTAESLGDYFRIRVDKLNKSFSMDYHQKMSSLGSHEIEVDVSDPEQTMKILKLLGLEVECTITKRRDKYQKEEVTVVLDDVEELGGFVEVEILGDETPENTALIKKTAVDLGFNYADANEDQGYPDILLEKISQNS